MPTKRRGGGRRASTLRGTASAASALALLAVSCATGDSLGAPDAVTDGAERVGRLWDAFFLTGVAVSAVVVALLAWAVLRYRARGRTDLPSQTRQHLPLEILWTAIPIAIVVGLFVGTYDVEREVDAVSGPADLEVNVTGFNWQWRFRYPEQGITVTGSRDERPVLVLPAGGTVRFHLTAVDVIHAFYVPGFLFKRDAIPGRVTTFDVVPRRPGEYEGECAEFCGLNHAYMGFVVRIVSPDEFDAWVASAGKPSVVVSPA